MSNVRNPWQSLNRFTSARIGIGRAGSSITTEQHLQFQLDHARARDAVHLPLDFALLQRQLEPLLAKQQLSEQKAEQRVEQPCLTLASQAQDRHQYLQRPDLGRRLTASSAQQLENYRATHADEIDIAFVIADGLSSAAVAAHAAPMLENLLSALAHTAIKPGPVVLVEQGRVAVGDAIGELLNARLLVLLIGERPGLSSPDSLGCYFTYRPQRGKTDAERNCISNIRAEGLSYEQATHKLMYLIKEAEARGLCGVMLKDESDNGQQAIATEQSNFLVKKD